MKLLACSGARQQRMTSFTYGANPTRVLASARLNSREAARKITAGIARGHVRGRCRLFLQVVMKNRVNSTSPNNMKGHDGYFHRLIMSDDVDMWRMACDEPVGRATRIEKSLFSSSQNPIFLLVFFY